MMPLQLENRIGSETVRRPRDFLEGRFLLAMDRDESEDLPRSSQTVEARGQASVKAFQ